MDDEIVLVSGRGTVTLPEKVRRDLGLKKGDVLRVRVVEGAIHLTPAAEVPLELYTEERLAEFREAEELSAEELATVDRAWGLTKGQ